MLELLALAMLTIIATLLAWLSLCAWRTKNGFIKWGATSLAALSSIAVTLISLVLIVGLFKLHARTVPAPVTKVAGTPEQIQRGKAISDGFCSACHSKTGSLTGGLDVGEHFPVPIGSFVSSNLTPAGQLSRWSDGDIFRAIRNSVDPDGRSARDVKTHPALDQFPVTRFKHTAIKPVATTLPCIASHLLRRGRTYVTTRYFQKHLSGRMV